jgi:phosphomannomutase
MMNYTTAGRSSSPHERGLYEEWDIENGERKRIVSELGGKFPDLEAKLGGQISIDIQPEGHNKSLASKWIRKNKTKDMVFFGDKCFEGGNDYDVKVDVLENGGKVFEVGDYKNTFSILQNADL